MVAEMNDLNVQCLKMKMPTYLKRFVMDDTDINLVCNVDVSKIEEVSEYNIPKSNLSTDQLDLTGNPLEIDLNGDDSLGEIDQFKKMDNWTADEANYGPLPVMDARDILNKVNRAETALSIPTYCLCHDNDNNTIILGTHNTDQYWMTYIVDYHGYFPEDHEYLYIDYMKKQHLEKVKGKIFFSLKWNYIRYGSMLQITNTKSLLNCDHIGCINFEVTSNDPDSHNMASKRISINVQAIIGHPRSTVYFLWEQLCQLQNYLDILTNNEDCIINQNGNSQKSIIQELDELIGSVDFLKHDNMGNLFDLSNLRQPELQDKLWNILIKCQDLSTLKDCFTYFFQEFSECENKPPLGEVNQSNISTFLSGIKNGTIAIPSLTNAQSLELLFELGTEKLFKDYMVIINHFYSASIDNIAQQWKKYCTQITIQESKKKTRMTVLNKGALTTSTVNNDKLGFLGRMHASVELMYVLQLHGNVNEYNFDQLCQNVLKKYVEKNTLSIDFKDLLMIRLADITSKLNWNDSMCQDFETFLESWSVKMTTDTNHVEITTIFDVSKNPIFPPLLCGCEEPCGDTKMYYLAQYFKIVYPN